MTKYVTETNVASYIQVNQGKEKTFESQLIRSRNFFNSLRKSLLDQKNYFIQMKGASDQMSDQYLSGVIDGISNSILSLDNLENSLYPDS